MVRKITAEENIIIIKKMKRNNFIATSLVILLTCVLTTSCKKYNCECVATTAQLPPNSPTVGTSNFVVKGTKSKAKKQCEEHSTQDLSYGSKTTCTIK